MYMYMYIYIYMYIHVYTYTYAGTGSFLFVCVFSFGLPSLVSFLCSFVLEGLNAYYQPQTSLYTHIHTHTQSL